MDNALPMVIHPDGTEERRKVAWSPESIRAVIGGSFRIVSRYRGKHVIESSDWHARGLPENSKASQMCGRVLHGTILIIEEPK